MKKVWSPYARHILDTIAKIRRIEARGDLRQDEVLYDATLRNLQTLSEATQHLPDELKQQHPAIPWKQISGFRNILVHNSCLRAVPERLDEQCFDCLPCTTLRDDTVDLWQLSEAVYVSDLFANGR